MLMKPEDRSKVIALLVGIVVLFGYFFVAVLPRLVGSQQAARQAQNAVAGQNGVPGNAPPPNAPFPNTPAGSAPVPSFANVVLLAEQSGEPQAVTRDPYKPLASALAPRRGTTTASPPGGGQGISKGRAAPRNSSDQGRPLPGPVPARDSLSGPLALDGVIMGGAGPVAILRLGEETRSKRTGARLPGGLLVYRITEAGVQLKLGNRYLPFLKIGSSLQENAKKTPAEPAPVPASR